MQRFEGDLGPPPAYQGRGQQGHTEDVRADYLQVLGKNFLCSPLNLLLTQYVLRVLTLQLLSINFVLAILFGETQSISI